MPMTYTQEQREAAIVAVIAGLSAGTPLTVICAAEGMPNDDTVRDWAKADPLIERAIARAREAGADALAMECLTIADTQEIGETVTEKPDGTIERKTEDMLGHRRLRIDTRLKLLAKWDPKRYGDRLTHAGDPDQPVAIAHIRRTVVDPRDLG